MARNRPTIGVLLKEGSKILESSGVPSPSAESLSLLVLVTGREGPALLARPDEELSTEQQSRFEGLLHERASGTPLQYLRGNQEFYSLEFDLEPGVFIPRPETETIVEEVLDRNGKREPLIIDVGTGSGCLAVTLAREIPGALLYATDISGKAIRCAAANAKKLGVGERVKFLIGDLLLPLSLSKLGGRIDFIVSNPPYIPAKVFPHIQREVRDHEPTSALVPGETGLETIDRLLSQSPDFLSPEGCLVFEIGYDQSSRVKERLDALRIYDYEFRKDLSGFDRAVLAGKRNG